MTVAEAKAKIAEEWIGGYYEWLRDEKEMPEMEYGRKYGFLKGENPHEDNFETVKVYLEYFFGGRWMYQWEKAGYSREIIWELNREGFLSYKEYSNWRARNTGKTQWFFISQRVARQIYKEHKAA